jgi:hypothetical protein
MDEYDFYTTNWLKLYSTGADSHHLDKSGTAAPNLRRRFPSLRAAKIDKALSPLDSCRKRWNNAE